MIRRCPAAGLATALALAAGAAALLEGAAAAEEPSPSAEEGPRPLRIVLAARKGPVPGHNPLYYFGGFQTKTLVYEPLLRYGKGGVLEPVLAESWTRSPDGLAWTFRLREGVTDHAGEPLEAELLADHVARVAGNPGNRWLGGTSRILGARAVDARTLEIRLSEPWYLPGEMVVVNPWHYVPPAAFDHEGFFRNTVGTGPFRLVAEEPGVSQGYEAHASWWKGVPGVGRVEAKLLPNAWRENHEVLRAVLAGEVDLAADGEGPVIPRDELPRVEAMPGFRVWRSPGSSVHYLVLNPSPGPFADRDARLRFAAAVDRAELVAKGELGYAEPTTTFFRGGFAGWPAAGRTAAPSGPAPAGRTPLRLLLPAGATPRLGRLGSLLAAQAARAGFDLAVEAAKDAADYAERSKGADLLLQVTHGAPYDPWVSLQALFLNDPARSKRTAARGGAFWADAAMQAAILEAEAAPDDAARAAALSRCQARLDAEAPVVPLFINERIAVSVAGLEGLEFGTNAYDLGLASVRWKER